MPCSDLSRRAGNRIPGPVQHGFLGGRRRDLLRSMMLRIIVPGFLSLPESFGDPQFEMGKRHGRIRPDLLGGLSGELVSSLVARDA